MERTVDTIISYLENAIKEKQPIAPSEWLDAAMYLNVLSSVEVDKLLVWQQAVAGIKVKHIQDGMSVAEAKARVEATDAYLEMQKQKAKIDRIEEFIRLSKIQAKIRIEEYVR